MTSHPIAAHGRDVRLEGFSLTYPNGFTAVHPTDMTIRAGEFFSVLGPSGCGKTTILRAVSGFLAPGTGRILIGGEDMTATGPNARPTAMIFQSPALFPLMTVWENVAFGLEARGVPRRARRARAGQAGPLSCTASAPPPPSASCATAARWRCSTGCTICRH